MLLKYLTGATDLALNFRATYVYTVCTYNKTERSTLKSLIEEHARLDFSDFLPPCSQFSPLLVYYFT